MLKYLSIVILTFVSLALVYCDFRPSRQVIQYQEQVKLSSGEMIWVDIKRHYRLVGEIGQNANYLSGAVEISWDTGFEGVGRQSVFFDEKLYFIDKVDGAWYVVGYRYPYKGSIKGINAVNCRDTGYLINLDYNCVFHIGSSNNVSQKSMEAYDLKDIKMNILDTDGLKDWGLFPQPLNETKLFWSKKLELQKTQPKDYQIVGKPYSYLIH